MWLLQFPFNISISSLQGLHLMYKYTYLQEVMEQKSGALQNSPTENYPRTQAMVTGRLLSTRRECIPYESFSLGGIQDILHMSL
jgi:hypothetical protein